MEDITPPEQQQQTVNGQQPAQTQTPPVQQQDATESEELVPGIQVDPRSEWDSLREHLKKEVQDVDSWLKLVDLAEQSGNYDRTKETYEALLEQFPNTVSKLFLFDCDPVSHLSFSFSPIQSSVQIAYINFVLESSHPDKFQHAVTLFNRFLKLSPFVDLWKFYLAYVK